MPKDQLKSFTVTIMLVSVDFIVLLESNSSLLIYHEVGSLVDVYRFPPPMNCSPPVLAKHNSMVFNTVETRTNYNPTPTTMLALLLWRGTNRGLSS